MILVYEGIVNDSGLALREGQGLLNEVGLEVSPRRCKVSCNHRHLLLLSYVAHAVFHNVSDIVT
jgi:hypothetical protein